jgi:pimeloyl-ACP methyl ester carboxylesterase
MLEHVGRQLFRALGYTSEWVDTSVGPVHAWSSPGSGTLPPLLLFHGLAASAMHWMPLLGTLRRHVSHVWAVDLPGHGFSVRPEALTTTFLRTGLLEALDRVHGVPSVVVGNSLGGASAVRYLLERPERVRGAVLFSPAGAPLDHTDLASIRARFRVCDHAEAVRFVDDLHARPPHRLRSNVIAPVLRRSLQDPLVDSWLAQVSADDFLAPTDLQQLTRPVHVVFGKQERFFPTSSRDFWRTNLPAHAVYEEPEGFGHSPYLDDPAWAIARILAVAQRS